jgi:hypothetical protein
MSVKKQPTQGSLSGRQSGPQPDPYQELKFQLNRDIVEDMEVMKCQIIKELTSSLTDKMRQMIALSVADAKRDMMVELAAKLDARVDNNNKQIVLANNKQLGAIKEITKEIVKTAGAEIESQVYKKVINDMNTRIMPQLNNMASWVNFNLEDGNEIVNNYRNAVEYEAHGTDFLRLEGSGKKDSRIISPHVRTFFKDDSSED